MKKWLDFFLLVFSLGLLFGALYAINASLAPIPSHELEEWFSYANSNLPRNIGTIGTLDSVTYSNRTIYYNMTVFGEDDVKQVYKEHYDKFGDMLLYTVVIMNGQHGIGSFLATLLEQKGCSLGWRVYTLDGDCMEWEKTGHDLKIFASKCKLNPTEALHTILDMQVEIANLHLPVKPEDLQNPIRTAELNAIYGNLDESCLPQSVFHVGDNIVILYEVDEQSFDLDLIEELSGNSEFIDDFAKGMIDDADVLEFMGIIAISHSNLVIAYEGRNSKKKVEIRLPYTIIRRYCKVHQNSLLPC